MRIRFQMVFNGQHTHTLTRSQLNLSSGILVWSSALMSMDRIKAESLRPCSIDQTIYALRFYCIRTIQNIECVRFPVGSSVSPIWYFFLSLPPSLSSHSPETYVFSRHFETTKKARSKIFAKCCCHRLNQHFYIHTIRLHLFCPLPANRAHNFWVFLWACYVDEMAIFILIWAIFFTKANLMICCLWQQMAKRTEEGKNMQAKWRNRWDCEFFLRETFLLVKLTNQKGNERERPNAAFVRQNHLSRTKTRASHPLCALVFHLTRAGVKLLLQTCAVALRSIVCILCKLNFMLVVRQRDKCVYVVCVIEIIYARETLAMTDWTGVG